MEKASFIPHAYAWVANTCRTSADTLPRKSATCKQVMSFAQRQKSMATPVKSVQRLDDQTDQVWRETTFQSIYRGKVTYKPTWNVRDQPNSLCRRLTVAQLMHAVHYNIIAQPWILDACHQLYRHTGHGCATRGFLAILGRRLDRLRHWSAPQLAQAHCIVMGQPGPHVQEHRQSAANSKGKSCKQHNARLLRIASRYQWSLRHPSWERFHWASSLARPTMSCTAPRWWHHKNVVSSIVPRKAAGAQLQDNL